MFAATFTCLFLKVFVKLIGKRGNICLNFKLVCVFVLTVNRKTLITWDVTLFQCANFLKTNLNIYRNLLKDSVSFTVSKIIFKFEDINVVLNIYLLSFWSNIYTLLGKKESYGQNETS